MRIAFWGESVRSDAGIHMRAVVSTFSVLYPQIPVRMYVTDPRRQSPAVEKGEAAAVGCRSADRNPAAEKPVGKRRTDGPEQSAGGVVAGDGADRENGVPEKLCFLDCGSGLDARTRRILKQSEIVVVNLRQEEKELHRFFLEEARFLPGSRILLGNYCGESRFDRTYLERVYRVEPERILVLSENTEFDYARACGRMAGFVSRENRKPGSLRNQMFLEELKAISQSLLRDAGWICGRSLCEQEKR